MQHEAMYSSLSSRINHLEKLRHAALIIHVGTIGYLATKLLSSEAAAIWHAPWLVPLWLVLSGAWLMCLAITQFNLFKKTLLAATQLMRIEILNGYHLERTEIGYYCGRVSKDKRWPYEIYGCMPELLSALWFLSAVAYASALKRIDVMLFGGFAAVAFVVLASYVYCQNGRLFKKKDELELRLAKECSAPHP